MFKEIFDFIKNNKWYVLFMLGLLGLYFYQFHGGLSSDSEKWDHFGSYIGGIFSAITLLSVLHGMQLERKHFNEQKSEFEKEKKEQEERRRKEDFERTFFMMLEQHNLKISSIENNIDDVYQKLIETHIFENVRSDLEVGFLNKEYANINTYFLNLYRILRFIHNNKELNVNNEYSGLLRSFLSKKLLTILAFHLCHRDDSYNDFIDYIHEFNFLEHIDLIYLESLMLSKAMNKIDQKTIYQNILALDSLDDCDLNDLISKLDNSRGNIVIMNNASSNLVRSSALLECYRTILNKRKMNEQLDVTLLSREFNSDFFFSSLFLAIIKRFDKSAFTGNKHIEQILLHYKRYLN